MDSFAFITGLCRVSSSQEELLRRCPFALEPEESDSELFPECSGEFPVDCTGIVMVSPPESPEECHEGANAPTDNNDFFHTPPEGSSLASSQEQHQQQLKRSAAADPGGNLPAERATNDESSVAVDLGRDTDMESDFDSGPVTLFNSTEIRVSKRELPSNDDLCESPLKKSKILKLETPRNSLIADAGNTLDILIKTADKLKYLSEKSQNLGENSKLETPRGCLGTEAESFVVKFMRSIDRLCSLSKDKVKLDKNLVLPTSRSNLDAETLNHSRDADKSKGSHPGRESFPKRKIEFSTDLLDSFQEDEAFRGLRGSRLEGISKETEDSEAIRLLDQREDNPAKKSSNDIGKIRSVLSSVSLICGRENDDKQKHNMRVSLCGKENAREDGMGCDGVQCTASCEELTLLDVLRMLAQDCDHDPCLEKLTIYEAAKRRGLTFP
ncbi:hypothetical protein K2173_016905 [Erythroxylum novogranatense]|uniref:Uncharacterized protein n=1 Tax=Erythroxylum novogranatense TaxID=1862640 RepID=A0AAV8U8F7_9ROSI|nr:hypothetical protein K2173_016905 [Erythroxylum novogranatense]